MTLRKTAKEARIIVGGKEQDSTVLEREKGGRYELTKTSGRKPAGSGRQKRGRRGTACDSKRPNRDWYCGRKQQGERQGGLGRTPKTKKRGGERGVRRKGLHLSVKKESGEAVAQFPPQKTETGAPVSLAGNTKQVYRRKGDPPRSRKKRRG